MEKVTGIGELFFRAPRSESVRRWYQQHLGVSLTPSSYEESVWQQEVGSTVFTAFAETKPREHKCSSSITLPFTIAEACTCVCILWALRPSLA
jgi:hypothetical protein